MGLTVPGFMWLRKGTTVMLFWAKKWSFGFHESWRVCWLVEELHVSWKWFCGVALRTYANLIAVNRDCSFPYQLYEMTRCDSQPPTDQTSLSTAGSSVQERVRVSFRDVASPQRLCTEVLDNDRSVHLNTHTHTHTPVEICCNIIAMQDEKECSHQCLI